VFSVSEALHGAMKPQEILWELSAADVERILNAAWLCGAANHDGKNRLRHRRAAQPKKDLSGFFSR
jgi:hypothetical protein